MTKRRRQHEDAVGLVGRVVAIVALLATAVGIGLWVVNSRPDFVVSRAKLEPAAPRMLQSYGTSRERSDGSCRKVQESEPFAYGSVCHLGSAEHRTVLFTTGTDGYAYRVQRGVFYRPDDLSPEPNGVCTRHVFGRWWEFAPLDDPNCPSGFNHYTGEG